MSLLGVMLEPQVFVPTQQQDMRFEMTFLENMIPEPRADTQKQSDMKRRLESMLHASRVSVLRGLHENMLPGRLYNGLRELTVLFQLMLRVDEKSCRHQVESDIMRKH